MAQLKASGSQTPEIASSSVLAYTLAVQHGHTSNLTTLNTSPLDFDQSDDPLFETFLLARVLSFTPSQSRTITRVYEINNFVAGRAVELIPGGISDDNVSITRIEGYQQTILEALDPRGHRWVDQKGNAQTAKGFPQRGGIDNLTFQKKPFQLLRYIIFPEHVLGGGVMDDSTINARLDIYCNCFVESITKTIDVSSGGGGLVQSEATIQVTKRRSRFLQIADSEQLASSLITEAADTGKFGQPRNATNHPDWNSETQQYTNTNGSLGKESNGTT